MIFYGVPRVDSMTDMSAFGVTVKAGEGRPDFIWCDEAQCVYKSAGWILIRDDGTVHGKYEPHLTHAELLIFYGALERAYAGGPKLAKSERWTRRRQSKNRKRGYWVDYVYVAVRQGEVFDVIRSAMSAQPECERRTEKLEGLERSLTD